jgi:hypothetical protein
LLHQVGDLFELNVKLRCQKVKVLIIISGHHQTYHKHKYKQASHFLLESFKSTAGGLYFDCTKCSDANRVKLIKSIRLRWAGHVVRMDDNELPKKTFVNNQLDAQLFFMYVYFYSLHVSCSHVSIINANLKFFKSRLVTKQSKLKLYRTVIRPMPQKHG